MIKKIYHISDTHIPIYRNLKRFTQVINNLIYEISKRKSDDAIVVITGDIFHTKTELSPQAISMANRLFKGLSEHMPVIVIAGNHDANLSNRHRLDAITPIIQSLDIDNLYYYKNTGWYGYQNLNFWVSSVFDQRLPQVEQYRDDKINILLYHGMVQNVSVNNITMSGKFKLKEFDNFDYVLLGDIHKYQVLNTNPLTAYAGSLMQLNFGEDVDFHGMVQWDLVNNSLQHIQIDNDYKYYNVIVQNGQLVDVPNINSKYPKIKIKYKNTNLQRVRQIQQQLKLKYNVQQFMLFKISQELQLKSSTFKYSLENLDNVEYQENLIKEYIQHSNLQVKKDDLEKVIQLNEKINKVIKLGLNKPISNQNLWTIEELQFSNFFSFGSNNYIDFRKHGGIVGIVGPNKAGKSSIIQTILFMLYDKTSKTHKTLPLLNKSKSNLYGKITININGKKYFIQKEGKLNKKRDSLPIKIKFYTIDQDGIQVDLSGTQRNDTNSIIQSYIGNYDDAASTFFSTQEEQNSFIGMTSGNRKSQLNSLFNLNIFDDCYRQANEQSKSLKGYFKNIDIDKQKDKKHFAIKNNTYISEQNKKLQNDIKQLDVKINQLDVQLKSLIEQRQAEQFFNINISQVENNIKNITNKIDKLKKDRDENIKLLEDKKNNLNELDQIVKSFDRDQFSDKRDQLFLKLKQFQKIKNELNRKESLYKKSLRQIELLGQVQYDQNCNYCMNNPLTKNAIQQKKNINKIQEQINKLNNNLIDYNETSENYKQINKSLQMFDKQVMTSYNNCLKTINEINNKLNIISNNIVNIQGELNQNIITRDTYKQNENVIKKNLKLSNKIKELQNIQHALKKQKKGLDQSLLENKLKHIANIKNSQYADQMILDYNQKSEIYKIIQIYKTIMSRNGLQYYIITNIVTAIEKQMNQVLNTMTNFSVQFSMDGSSLDINIIYPDKVLQIQLCSGFERFIVSIALRHTLSTITNKSKSKMFVIDEGFGVLDGENVLQFNKIFEFISDKYQTLLLISHLDVMRQLFQDNIQIENKSGESKII